MAGRDRPKRGISGKQSVLLALFPGCRSFVTLVNHLHKRQQQTCQHRARSQTREREQLSPLPPPRHEDEQDGEDDRIILAAALV